MEKKLKNSPEGVTQEQTPLGAVVYEGGTPSNDLVHPAKGKKIEAEREEAGDAGTAPNTESTEAAKAEKEAAKEAKKADKETAKDTKKQTKDANQQNQ